MNQINQDQIKDLANLYDIKILSQAVADRGWACLSKEGNFLSQAQAPTLYNSLVEKLGTVEKELGSFETFISGFCIHNIINVDDTYVYEAQSKLDGTHNLYRCRLDTIDNPNWEDLGVPINPSGTNIPLAVGNNLLVASTMEGNNTYYIKVYNKADMRLLHTISGLNTGYDALVRLYFVDGIFYLSYHDANNNYHIDRIEDNVSATIESLRNDLVALIGNPVLVGNKIMCAYNKYIISTDDDFTTLTQVKSVGGAASSPSSLYKIGQTIVAGKDYNQGGYISTDNGDTWTSTTSIGYHVGNYGWCDGTQAYITRWETGHSNYELYKTTDFVNYESVDTADFNGAAIDVANEAIFSQTDRTVKVALFSTKTSIDTFVIDGNEVGISYAKAQDGTKIVTEFSQITSMQTIGNYLGYSNYFFLSQAPGYEGVTLPWNSNLWTWMYVGDNYEETNIPTGNATRLLPQAEVVVDSSATPTLAIKKNTNYKLSNNAITSITISSCEDSPLVTKIDFTTGATAPTLTDNASIDWADGQAPVFQSYQHYWIIISDKVGFVKEIY